MKSKLKLLNRSSRRARRSFMRRLGPSHASDVLRDSNNLLFFILIFLSVFSVTSAMEKDQVGVATQALGAAVVTGNLKEVKNAIAKGADVNAVYTKKLFDSLYGGPVTITFPLIVHALHHFPDDQACLIIKALLAHNADPNKKDVGGCSPLHWASRRNRFKCMVLLLRNGADVNAQDNSGSIPLNLVVGMGYHPNKTRLAPFGTRSIQLLLNAGANPTIRNGSGYSSLHSGAYAGRPGFFEELIKFVPTEKIIQEKRKVAVVLLLCFKRFENKEGVKVTIPKDIRYLLCEYAGNTLVDALVENKIETLRKWFALKVEDQTIGKIAESGKITSAAHNVRYDKVQELTDLDKLDQHKPVIRKSIKKLLQDTPLWGDSWSKQKVKR